MSQTHADIQDVLHRTHLPVLDGLRAIAVMVVIADHAQLVPRVNEWAVFSGGMGVSLFFVLSGFLITWLLLKEHDKTGGISLRDFYIRRVLRIWPAYYCVLGLSYLLRSYLNPHAPSGGLTPTLLSASTFTYDYFVAVGGASHLQIAQLWTVSIEEQFYLLWPALLIVLLRHGREWTFKVMVAIVVLVMAWRCVLYLGLGVRWTYLYTAFDTRLDSLAVGCLLALATTSARFIRFARLAARSPFMPLVPLLVLVANNQAYIYHGYHWTIAPTVESVCMLVLIVQLLQLFPSRLWSWLEHPVVRYIGVVSYSVYLYQYIGLALGSDLRHGAGPLGLFVLGGACTIALASVSYYSVERPFLRLRRWFTPARAAV